MSTAILLIAHGSRRQAANADLQHVATALQGRLPDQIVEFAYLELASPTIPEGLQKCLRPGVNSIHMLPYFLSSGSHVTDDLEGFREEFQKQHPSVECRLSPPIGLHPFMIDILIDRLNEGGFLRLPVST